jgi:hypothetical protein
VIVTLTPFSAARSSTTDWRKRPADPVGFGFARLLRAHCASLKGAT